MTLDESGTKAHYLDSIFSHGNVNLPIQTALACRYPFFALRAIGTGLRLPIADRISLRNSDGGFLNDPELADESFAFQGGQQAFQDRKYARLVEPRRTQHDDARARSLGG